MTKGEVAIQIVFAVMIEVQVNKKVNESKTFKN